MLWANQNPLRIHKQTCALKELQVSMCYDKTLIQISETCLEMAASNLVSERRAIDALEYVTLCKKIWDLASMRELSHRIH